MAGPSRWDHGRGPSSRPVGWAICSSQQLVKAGEVVLDVPATLASRVRVLGTGRSDKNDPNDALSVAIAALRSPGLRSVRAADHGEVLRLLATPEPRDRETPDVIVSRLHATLIEPVTRGNRQGLNASDAMRLAQRLRTGDPRRADPLRVGPELLRGVERLDVQLKASHRRIQDGGPVPREQP